MKESNFFIIEPHSNLTDDEAVNWNLPMAGSMMAALPVLLIYTFLGRYFIRGLLSGSVKE